MEKHTFSVGNSEPTDVVDIFRILSVSIQAKNVKLFRMYRYRKRYETIVCESIYPSRPRKPRHPFSHIQLICGRQSRELAPTTPHTIPPTVDRLRQVEKLLSTHDPDMRDSAPPAHPTPLHPRPRPVPRNTRHLPAANCGPAAAGAAARFPRPVKPRAAAGWWAAAPPAMACRESARGAPTIGGGRRTRPAARPPAPHQHRSGDGEIVCVGGR